MQGPSALALSDRSNSGATPFSAGVDSVGGVNERTRKEVVPGIIRVKVFGLAGLEELCRKWLY